MRQTLLCSSGWLFSRDVGKKEKEWESVTLPHSVFTEPEIIGEPQLGKACYRFPVQAPEEWKEKIVYFEIGAAMQTAEVFLNGKKLFTHYGGYQRFFIPLSDYLNYGEENLLELELDNAPSCDMPPGKEANNLDFCYHSGLYRDAKLHVYDPVHISDELAVSIPAGGGVFIRTESLEPGRARLTLSCHVMHEIAPARRFELLDKSRGRHEVTLSCRILSPEGECVFAAEAVEPEIRPNCDHSFCFEAEISDPELWSPESPKLYHAEFHVCHNGSVTDLRSEHFGIRTIDFRKDGFYLNGEKVFLNGTNRHMEYPFVGNAVPRNAQWRDARLIRDGGFNFVRLCHYNQDPAFLDACDRLGLFVMPAIPGWQAYHPNGSFIQNAFRDCRELVRSLRNRPSVILWELSLNEAYPPTWVNAEFHRIAHEEYPGPFCFSAGDTWGLFEGWDVLFPCAHCRNSDHKALFLREYGDWVFGGDRSTSRQRRGASVGDQLVQAWNFLWTLNRLSAVPGMAGGADWGFLDYNRGFSKDMERSGSMDLYRLPKLKYFFYQSQRSQGPMLHAVYDPAGEKLVVFSNCEEIEISRNGHALRRQKPDSGPDTPYGIQGSPGWETALPEGFDLSGGNPFDGGNVSHLKHPPFTFFNIAPIAEGEVLTLRAFSGGEELLKKELRKPGRVHHVETRLRTEGVEPVPGDLVFVDAILRDASGTLVPEEHPVALEFFGNAELIGGMEKTEAGIASWLVRITGGKYEFHAYLPSRKGD